MSTHAAALQRTSWRDYYELTKPRVVMLMILTSVIGMLLAVPGMVPLDILVFGNLGIALCAGSAAAVNHLVDRHIDIKMARTSKGAAINTMISDCTMAMRSRLTPASTCICRPPASSAPNNSPATSTPTG